MILTENGVLKLMQRIKSFIASQLNTKAPSVHTHSISEIDDLSSLQMGGGYTKSEVDTLLNDYILKSGTNALSGSIVPSTNKAYDFGDSSHNFKIVYADSIKYGLNNGILFLSSGNGANIELYGNNGPQYGGWVSIKAIDNNSLRHMILSPDGTWKWNGTACQITSDQRYKQQINKIDTALLDAWESVELVQFKYNDAVDAKKDKARLHTGYVVQQIDEACKSHNVDISEYGLYCHEEYPERTEEVTIENEDGTTTKETKVIEEASEHYSLRYTEALIVECAYLRRENNRLKERLSKIEKLLNI